MRKYLIILGVAFFVLPLHLWSLVFVNSSPFKATVSIGKQKLGETPLLIRTNIGKDVELTFEKQGFYTKKLRVQIKNPVTNISVPLISKSFSVQFPNRQYIILNGKKYESDHIQNLPNGYYLFEQDRETIYARRVNPNRSLFYMNLALFGVGIAGGITGVLVGNGVYQQYQAANNYIDAIKLLNTSMALDNLALASFVVAGASGGLSVYYFLDDLNTMKKNKDIKIKSQEYMSKDRDLFEKALDEMGQDRSKEALQDFNAILDGYPESRFYPMALLRRAKIYNRQEKYADAIKDLEKIRSDYPVYDVYALALKDLGDLYNRDKKTKEALSVYRELRQINSVYPPYLIDYYYLKILNTEWQKTGDVKLKNELKSIGNAFVENATYPDAFKAIVRSMLVSLE